MGLRGLSRPPSIAGSLNGMNVHLHVRRGSAHAQTIRLRRGETIVGRAKGCRVRVPSGQVSRRHCRLLFQDGFLEVEDLASANGTFVDGIRIAKPCILRPGARLGIGPLIFVVDYDLTVEAEDRLRHRESELAALPPGAGSATIPRDAIVVEEEEEIVALPIQEEEGDTRDLAPLQEEDAPKARKSRKKRRKSPAEEEPAPDVSAVLRKHGPWNVPAGEDLRDLLSRIEEEGQSEH